MASTNVQNITTETEFLDTVKGLDKAFISFAGLAGIAGFEFDIDDETEITLENESTDHYLEDNSYINDNISLRPEIVRLVGQVGDIADRINKSQNALEKATEKLTTLVSYLPAITDTASRILNNADVLTTFNGATNMGEDLFKTYRDVNIPDGRQQEVFLYFEALRNSKALFTVQTCYRYYTNMVVKSLKFRQSKDNKDISEVVIILKRFRFVEPKNAYSEQSVTGRMIAQVSEVVSKGLASVTNLFMSTSEYATPDTSSVVVKTRVEADLGV